MKNKTFITALGLLGLFLWTSCNSNTRNEESKINSKTVTESQIIESFDYLVGRALTARQEIMDIAENDVDYNVIKYNPVGKAEFVNPNLDVAYMEAWFAVDDNSAVVLEIPQIEDRYSTVQLMDEYAEVFANIHKRNYPEHYYGKFALVTKDSKAQIPKDAHKIIVPDKKTKMLARVELQDDWDEAVELQKQFKATVIGNPVIAPPLDFPLFTNRELDKIALDVFNYSDKLLAIEDKEMPDREEKKKMALRIKKYIAQSDSTAKRVETIVKKKAIPMFLAYAGKGSGELKNNWILSNPSIGKFNGDYKLRSGVNYLGIWANTMDEVIYAVTSIGSDNLPLGDGKSYEIHFAKENLPADNVHSFWSIILVNPPSYRVVPNEMNRYNFNNYSDLTYEKDGSLKLYVSPEYNSKWSMSNWLPSPKKDKIMLTMRMYVPKQSVVEGLWYPPLVTLIEQ